MGQLRVDPYVEDDHDHFVCSECKSVYDVLRNEDYINNKISEYGKIDKTEVIYKGICKSCAKRM